jgi:FSR family fosmidomycin resistance protein-like MFS transporter
LGHHRIVLTGFITLIFPLPYLILAGNVDIASALLVPIGVALYSVSSPIIEMGQKYLRNHVGLASGATFAVAVAIDGITSPFLR